MRRLTAALCTLGLLLGACTDDEGDDDSAFVEADDEFDGSDSDGPEVEADDFDDELEDGQFDGEAGDEGFDDDAGGAESVPLVDDVDGLLGELLEGGFCDPADVEDLGPVTAMHFVVQGELHEPCYVEGGVENDPRLLEAWRGLVDITPNRLVSFVSLIAGYECSSCDTLAFVSALDDQASFFLLGVDVLAAADDPNELLVTMQHELSHVFTQIPDEQLDVGDDDGSCPTFHNGTGCFVVGSYMAEWVDEFWSDDLLAQLPPDGEPSSDEGADERCLANPGFAGPYAAVSPEEDFAETFAAFVFDIDLADALDPKLSFFERYPEFVEIQQNAEAAGLAEIPYEFETCG